MIEELFGIIRMRKFLEMDSSMTDNMFESPIVVFICANKGEVDLGWFEIVSFEVQDDSDEVDNSLE